MAYPRLSRVTRGNLRTVLEANSIFASLSSDQKNLVIEQASQKTAWLRNSLSKEDYQSDTVSDASIATPSLNYGDDDAMAALAITLGVNDIATYFFNTEQNVAFFWNGTSFV